jgi:hypothetical protein
MRAELEDGEGKEQLGLNCITESFEKILHKEHIYVMMKAGSNSLDMVLRNCVSHIRFRFISNCKWVLMGGSITVTIQHTNTQVTYTLHISHTHKYTYNTK